MSFSLHSFKNTLQFLSTALIFALFLQISPVVLADEDLLPPEQAFALTAWIENDTVIAEYSIADQYYLYRDSFSFTVDTPNVEFGTPQASEGKIKNDEFFGEVEIYRKTARVSLPIIYNGVKPSELVINTSSQGCADIGVCYPPLYQSLTFDTASTAAVLPVAYHYQPKSKEQNIAAESLQSMNDLLAQMTNNVSSSSLDKVVDDVTETVAPIVEPIVKPVKSAFSDDSSNTENSPSPLDLLQALGDDLGLGQEDEIPAPDDAFRLSTSIDENNILRAIIDLHPSTYLYKDKVKLNITDGTGHLIGAVSLPKGDQKHDEFFGDIVVFHNQLKIAAPLITEQNATKQLVVSLGYQGCVEDKICYPPITKNLLVDVDQKTVEVFANQPKINASKASYSNANNTINQPDAVDQKYLDQDGSEQETSYAVVNKVPPSQTSTEEFEQTEQDRFAGIIADGDILFIIGSFFLAGLLLTFTPCVFPMIPILSGIIAGQGDEITTKKAFTLSLVYVLAMASTYAIVGYITGTYGAAFNIQAWMQDPVILSIFAAIFVLLSLSMFGFYDIQMPSFIQSRLTEVSNNQQGGNLFGVAIMGFLSALIVGPCITAPLVGALIFIAQAENGQLGAMALFALGLGMGTPLILIGTSAGKFLPRAGTWMDIVKAIFGVSLLAVAIWMLERILPTEIIMVLIALLLILSGIYILSSPIKDTITGWSRIGRGIGFILVIYGTFYLVGMAAGGKDLIQPLKGIIAVNAGGSGGSASSQHVVFQPVKGVDGLNQALKANKGNIVMFDFYADWCISCKEMEKYAFANPKVLEALKGVSTLQTDVTDNDKQDTDLMDHIGIYGPPAILFYDREGNEIPATRVVGEMSGEEFAAHVIKVINRAK